MDTTTIVGHGLLLHAPMGSSMPGPGFLCVNSPFLLGNLFNNICNVYNFILHLIQ